jgi:hypothetical protein
LWTAIPHKNVRRIQSVNEWAFVWLVSRVALTRYQ